MRKRLRKKTLCSGSSKLTYVHSPKTFLGSTISDTLNDGYQTNYNSLNECIKLNQIDLTALPHELLSNY